VIPLQTHVLLLADTLKTTAFGAALPALEKTQGYIVAISLIGAQLRFPGVRDGCISKYAVNRLVEYIALGRTRILYFFVFSRRLMM
jgi:NAD(P)-dependent dehydrogenase (short-subunit alcohol dehydrogenase family)